ncbi:MAG: bifunctional hydroxymethylpyrimidine kinase/phosphomethylpyrimidine kinase [Actinomycetota bacterium]|jgi:hydroxymethylpyrimidine/phosphomethylpyrimidine kinase|nr:bifunctional hydroxymethylpyrimidine kinase/phosphomethylpyrimidine kinase [Actinomycetota bacterium]|tara:strand:+ start:498 stop:1316 length:819 start_codon:yes stop_codon:yes gene_type:complete
MTQPPVVLTVAGSDSGGGSGLQADLRTFSAQSVHGVCALTVVSSQNTEEFRSAFAVPRQEVKSQIEAIFDDFDVKAVKTGLLYSEENIQLIAQMAEEGALPLLVVDPVIVDRHGNLLYKPESIRLIRERLIPNAFVATPNHLEAMHLLGVEENDDLDALSEAALELADMGPEVVVLTGGRRNADSIVDVVAHRGEVTKIEFERSYTKNVRGTGDTFSAAIAAGLARGLAAVESVKRAQRFTVDAVRRSADWELGSGQGPIDHLGHLDDARLD